MSRTPFEGIGKPEPLLGDLIGFKQRIDEKNRLVYEVTDVAMIFLVVITNE
jgi:toxin YoeB